jgi:hypothetical protein
MQLAIHRWVAVAALATVGAVQAAPVDFVTQGSTYQYKVLGTDLWTGGSGGNWAPGVGLSTFDNFATANPISGWATGTAAFGNSGSWTTAWAANTDLAIYKTFEVSGMVTGDLTLNVASDNGFLIFLNDQLLAQENAEGFTSYWEYTFTLSPGSAYINSGTNVLKILAEDHGGATFFDMKLSGSVVPSPGSLALAGLALLGLAATGRRGAR